MGTTKKYGGMGLGLALAKRLVEGQGGRVGARSAPGEGSTFYAVLPVRPPDGPSEIHPAWSTR
jgi:signal transduction histidine kinase